MKSNVLALNNRRGLVHLLIGILVLGTLWGMSEVALGGGLRAANFPYRSGLLTGIGLGILGIAFAVWRQPLMLAGIGIVAAMTNFLVVPILHVSIMCKANSCLAVGIEAASLGLMAAMLLRKSGGNTYTRMASAGGAALLASVVFYFVGLHVAPCNYLLSFTSPGAFVVKEGLVWTAFSAVLMPLGYLVGEKVSTKALPSLAERAVAYYGMASAVVVSSLGVSALAIVAGL
jgi:hypothetical protein